MVNCEVVEAGPCAGSGQRRCGSSDHHIGRACLRGFCKDTPSTRVSASSLRWEKSERIVIFAELVSSGQRSAEAELSRLVWAIRSLQEEVSRLRFISASSAPSTDGKNRRGREER